MKPNPAEYTLCAWVEFAYQALTKMIDWCLTFMETQLKAIIASINAIYAVLVKQMKTAVDTITDIITKCIDAYTPQFSEDDLNWLNAVRASLCEMLRKCRFVYDMIVAKNNTGHDTWLDFTNLESLDTYPYFAEMNDPYAWFEKVVCNFSLKDLIRQTGELTKQALKEMMDKYILGDGTYGLSWARTKAEELWQSWNDYIHKPLDKIIPFHMFSEFWTRIFDWIPEKGMGIETNPKKMNIFDLMALLDQLTQCAFAICNFVTSVMTYKQDKKTKMYIDWDNELPIPPTALTGIYKLDKEISDLVNSWRTSATSRACVTPSEQS